MRTPKTRYYRETERTYHFADGEHYHTDNAIWVVEPTHNRSYRKVTITYFDKQLDLETGDFKDVRYSDEYTWAGSLVQDKIKERHLIEITKAEAFEVLL